MLGGYHFMIGKKNNQGRQLQVLHWQVAARQPLQHREFVWPRRLRVQGKRTMRRVRAAA